MKVQRDQLALLERLPRDRVCLVTANVRNDISEDKRVRKEDDGWGAQEVKDDAIGGADRRLKGPQRERAAVERQTLEPAVRGLFGAAKVACPLRMSNVILIYAE